jgi:hypothetical protein
MGETRFSHHVLSIEGFNQKNDLEFLFLILTDIWQHTEDG